MITTSDGASTSATRITHYHVTDSVAGYLPEAEPYVTTDSEMAVDVMTDLLHSRTGTQEPDRGKVASAQPVDVRGELFARLEQHGAVCEYVGDRAVEVMACTDSDCLKYCPANDCRNATDVADVDAWCWVCGARYVAADACDWLA